MDIEFGNEYRTYGVGLGGYIEGMGKEVGLQID